MKAILNFTVSAAALLSLTEEQVDEYVNRQLSYQLGNFIAERAERYVTRKLVGFGPQGELHEEQVHTMELHVFSEKELEELIQDAQRAALKEVADRIALERCYEGKNFC